MIEVWEAVLAASRAGRPAALVTVVGVDGSAPRHTGSRMLVYADGSIVGTVGGGHFEHRLVGLAQEVIQAGVPRRDRVHLTRDLGMCCGGAMETLIEPLAPVDDLVIHGAGHVSRALAPLAHSLGYRLTVVDEREGFAVPEHFPPGTTLLEADPVLSLPRLPTGPRAHHLVVTHDHGLDQALVERLLPTELAWLGLIGSRAKVARFLVRLRAAGMDEALFRRLCAPVGLDIGAETPEEIAVSIAAELVRVRRGADRLPQPLSAIPLPARGGDGRARPASWPDPTEE